MQIILTGATTAAMPTPLTDAINNMKVIETIFESAEKQSWQIW